MFCIEEQQSELNLVAELMLFSLLHWHSSPICHMQIHVVFNFYASKNSCYLSKFGLVPEQLTHGLLRGLVDCLESDLKGIISFWKSMLSAQTLLPSAANTAVNWSAIFQS